MLGEIASLITIFEFIGKILKSENRELSDQITHGLQIFKNQELTDNESAMNAVIDSFSYKDNANSTKRHLSLIAEIIAKAFEDNHNNKDKSIHWGDFIDKAGYNIFYHLDNVYAEYLEDWIVMNRTKKILKREGVISFFVSMNIKQHWCPVKNQMISVAYCR